MSKGILLFARNNSHVDYIKLAYFFAKRARDILDLPVSVVTDSKDFLLLQHKDAEQVFDEIISFENDSKGNIRLFRDGGLASKRLEWKNSGLRHAYDLSPYDETIVLDTDIVITNKNFLKCFDSQYDLMMYDHCVDLVGIDRGIEFTSISDTSVDFYWATVIFFRKTDENKIFFDLIQHIYDNWKHYVNVYQLTSMLYRNDFAVSIAVHIMNGFQSGNFVKSIPGNLYYTTDKSILWEIDGNSLFLLLEKPDYTGEYTALRIKDANVHVMNKFSLNRCIDEQ